MSNLSAIGAIGTETSSAASRGLLFNKEEHKKEKQQSVAYMGPSIGNILNGSHKPETSASAFQA